MRRSLLSATVVLLALLVQTTVLSGLDLPGGSVPDLLLVLVVALALAQGAQSGVVTGFVTGLLADAGADHELGRSALAYALVGYLAGLLHDDRPRSPLLAPAAVAGAAAVAVTAYALQGLLLGDPRTTVDAFWRSLVGTAAYSVALTPLVVPVVGGLVRRLDPDPSWR